MKLIPITVALLGASSALKLESQADAHMRALAMQGMSMKDVTDKQSDDDQHLAQLVTQALAGAPPGEITEPVADNANDKESDTQMTKGKTINYEYFWKYACAFTKWIPTNQFLHAAD